MKKLLLTAAGIAAASVLSGANLIPGDTSYETEPDTLTSGNLDPGYLPFVWDDKEAFHGKRSLRVDWDAKNRRGSFYNASDGWVDNHICLDTADLENGKRYTFSFYAKAEHDGAPLALWLCPNAAWGYWPKKSNYNKTFRLTTDWKRYSFTFTADLAKNPPFKGYSCLFGFKKAKPGKFWIDAVQLDAGETATGYQPSAPMSCGVRLDVPEGGGELRHTVWSVYYPTDQITGTVRVASNDGKGGKLTVRTIDWQGKTVSEFGREVNGGEAIAFKADPKLRGWFRTIASISRGGKEIVRHSANYMVIDPPVETVPGIEPYFGMISGGRMLPLMKRFGVKRVQVNKSWKTLSSPGLEPEKGKFDFRPLDRGFAQAEQYGMKVKFTFSANYMPEWYFDPKLVAEVKKYPGAVNYLFTPESVGAWKKMAAEMLNRYGSRIDTIELGGEDNGRIGGSAYYRAKHPEWLENNWVVRGPVFDLFYDAVAEVADGIRKQYPKMKISVVRPSEGREGDNWTFVRAVFAKIGKHFDAFGIDTYMLNPYSVGPDIKAHNGSVDGREWTWNLLQEFIKKYGCDQKLFISEAGLECDTRFPDESVWQRQRTELMSKDFLISRALGFYAYDLFSPLSTFTAGKYSFGMLQNHRIQMALPAVCQAARLVENSVKTRYIRLPGSARITLFKKHDGTGTAALWADQGYIFQPADAKALCVMDLMGNAVNPDKNGKYTLGVYPLLITGAKYDAMENAILKGEIAQNDFCRLFYDIRKKDTLTFRVENTSNRKDLRMKLEVRSDAGKHGKEFSVSASSQRTFTLPVSGSKATVEMRRTDSPAVETREIELSKPIALKLEPVKFAEVSEKFHILPNEPWTPWSGPKDLSAEFFGSWNEKYLQIDVNVTDDLHFAVKPMPWDCDSLQVAIDPKSNAGLQKLSPGMLGRDDVEFAVAITNGKPKCVVSFGRKDLFEPGDLTVVRDEAKKQTRYRVRVRWSKLGVEPKPGMVFGLSLVLFDDDAGNGPEYFAQIGGGIAKRKDPRKYLKFVLE